MNEFSLIDQFFKTIPVKRKDVHYGIGDDAASLQVPADKDLLISTDTLVSGVHFLPEWNPYDIAYRAVMVNVSDMAAMAADPAWLTLALTLPEIKSEWLQAFAKGIQDAIQIYNIDLVGGDTTKGPLAMTLTIMGLAPKGQAIKRNNAKAGDVIFISGDLGGAALAVQFLSKQDLPKADKNQLMEKLLHPKPRIDLNTLLRTYASAAIDISDGLSADLEHICQTSNVGACVEAAKIPIHPLLLKYISSQAIDLALSGGDDYELCFTVPASKVDLFNAALQKAQLQCHAIGVIETQSGLRIRNQTGQCTALQAKGYQHF